MMKKIEWETITGLKSGEVIETRETLIGKEYKALLPNGKVVWVNEKSIIEK